MIRLYAFLGNYGAEYARTRHNVAWQFLESLPFYGSLRFANKFKGEFAAYETAAGRVYLLRPLTYMNLSGDSVAELARFHQIGIDEILVIHDELELPFGTFGFKFGGGLGGHNGLRSMVEGTEMSMPPVITTRVKGTATMRMWAKSFVE